MIVKTINIQVISVYESIFVGNIIHITYYLKNKNPKISKEKGVIHNKIQKQLVTILYYVINRSIDYVLFGKYTLHD